LLIASSYSINHTQLAQIAGYIKGSGTIETLSSFSSFGSMGGYFTFKDVWVIHSYLQQQFPKFVSASKSIGKTYLRDDIPFFTVGSDINNKKRVKKSAMLFTALHHSREPTSLSVLMSLFINSIKRLYANELVLTNETDIIFIPVFNVDSVKFINSSFGNKLNWEKASMIRKNRNLTNVCKIDNLYQGGVDLNRNYGYKFAYIKDHGGNNDPCRSDYRGPSAFSEPETQAMKRFIEHHKEIKSAMNFHAWGDLFISPFNYLQSSENLALKKMPGFWKVYNEFALNSPHMKKARFGNAMHAIQYMANGEASDWMLKAHKIIAMSPEVGTDDNFSEHFYIKNPKIFVPKVISSFIPTVEYFINMHHTSFSVVDDFKK